MAFEVGNRVDGYAVVRDEERRAVVARSCDG